MKKFSVLLALLLLATGAVSAKPKHPAPRLFPYQGEVSLRGAVSAPTPGLGISYINGVRFNPYLFVGAASVSTATITASTFPCRSTSKDIFRSADTPTSCSSATAV